MPDLATPAANAAVNAVTALIGFLSLHTTDPSTTGANEVTGGSYARQAITFGASSGGTATSTNGQTFTNMPSEAGNLWIEDPTTDVLLAGAARRVIATAEERVARVPRATIPGFMVDLLVEEPLGAYPTGCLGLYPADAAHLDRYLDRKSTRLNSSHRSLARMPSSA